MCIDLLGDVDTIRFHFTKGCIMKTPSSHQNFDKINNYVEDKHFYSDRKKGSIATDVCWLLSRAE